MRFTHIDVNFDVKYEGHQNCSKTLSMHILRVYGHLHMWHQNWCQYVWTSLCQFFFLNLLHSPCVWLLDIWHLFDNLTSFWQLDIFFDIWATGHMGNGPVMGWGGLSLSDCQVVKKMWSCKKDVKCQKVKYLVYGGGSQKIINWLNEVYRYWCQVDVKYKGHPNWSKILFMHIW